MRLWRRLRPYRRRVLVGLACLLAVDAVQMLGPTIVGGAVDALRAGAPGIGRAAWQLLAIGASTALLRFGWRYGLVGAARRLRRDTRQALYERLAILPPAFFARRSVGDLLSLASSDIESVERACGFGLLAAADALFLFAIGLCSEWRVSPELTLATLAPMPVVAFAAMIAGRGVQLRSARAQDSLAAFSERVRETLAGARVIKAHAREAAFLAVLDRDDAAQRRDQLALARWSASLEPLPALIGGAAFVILLGYGGVLALDGRITVGAFVTFGGYLALLGWPMNAIGMVVNLTRRGAAAAARLDAVLVEPPLADPVDALPPPEGADLAASALTYAHPGAAVPALVDVSFAVAAGATLGVVGATGSGKSTLASLIAGALDAPRVALTLGGVDLARLRRADRAALVVLAPQEPLLFSTTIRENIAFGLDVTDDAIVAAAAAAGIDAEIAAFPAGYATLVGERGVTLSGGQRQRVGIARALLRDPRVLVLDDALSAVDARTEGVVLANLRRLRAGRTTVIVAHRASAVRHGDEILVLANGRVTERGGHDALVAADGWYARLVRLQRAAGEGEAP